MAGVGESEGVKQPKPDPDFDPDFSKYDVVVSNFGWKAAGWPEKAQQELRGLHEEGRRAGGRSCGRQQLAGVEGVQQDDRHRWLGGRNAKDGPYVYYNKDGKEVRDPSEGKCGQHAPQNEFMVTMRDLEHPITKGLPDFWMHSKDECYSHLRGPAENMTVLATACDSPALQEAGRHEPMLMVIDYHKGRVFHTTLGHDQAGVRECRVHHDLPARHRVGGYRQGDAGGPEGLPAADKPSAAGVRDRDAGVRRKVILPPGIGGRGRKRPRRRARGGPAVMAEL